MRNNSDNIILENVGTNLQAQLNQMGWAQTNFAKMLCSADTEFSPHQPNISNYIYGTTEMRFYDFLCICQELKCHSSVLISITDQPRIGYQTIKCLKKRKLYKLAFGKQLTSLIQSSTDDCKHTRGKINSFLDCYTDAALKLNFPDKRITIDASTLYRYMNGQSDPPLLSAIVICSCFKTELSDFFYNYPD